MGECSWPSKEELDESRRKVAEMVGKSSENVRVVASPYRICPLGAHIDHQDGTVSAMTINRGVLLGFIPSNDSEVILCSGQFKGEVRFSVSDAQHPVKKDDKNETQENDNSKLQEECSWGNYARGAVYALQRSGHNLTHGIIGFICGSEGLDSSGLSSSAAVGVAYLLALEHANNITVSPTDNIEYDRLIENGFLTLKNGILDQSAILLSSYGCLTCMDCKTKEHKLIYPPELQKNHETRVQNPYKILLAFSGLKHALTTNSDYNVRVEECKEAARRLLDASGRKVLGPLLCDVEREEYDAYKCKLGTELARRAEHYFSENMRVIKGLDAWASGNLEEFGKLISASGLSSIKNYECGSEPLKQLYEILLRTPGVLGARFSGAGFRGCCIAFVYADRAAEAASYVMNEYSKVQPKLASQMNQDTAVVICESADCAKEEVEKLKSQSQEEGSLTMTEDEMFEIVLGEKPCYIRGLRACPKPKSKQSHELLEKQVEELAAQVQSLQAQMQTEVQSQVQAEVAELKAQM